MTKSVHKTGKCGAVRAALIALATTGLLAGCAGGDASSSATATAQTPDSSSPTLTTQTPQVGQGSSKLPFDAGLPVTQVIDVPAGGLQRLDPSGPSMGGDFRVIPSLPLDVGSAFGSVSDTPDNISSYDPAILSAGGTKRLRDHRQDPTYYEPQDGVQVGDWLIWREATLSNTPGQVSDNWRLVSYNLKESQAHILGSAQELNGTANTPVASGESLPAVLDGHAYFCSSVNGDGDWSAQILEVPLDGSQQLKRVATGCWPSSDGKQLLYLSNPRPGTWELRSMQSPRSLASLQSDAWSMSGLWSSQELTALAFSSESGSYLAAWRNADPSKVVWLHLRSTHPVVSVAKERMAIGGGSDAEHSEMLLWSWGSEQPLLLGEADGYSRPTLSASGDAVLVPTQQSGKVTWDIRPAGK